MVAHLVAYSAQGVSWLSCSYRAHLNPSFTIQVAVPFGSLLGRRIGAVPELAKRVLPVPDGEALCAARFKDSTSVHDTSREQHGGPAEFITA